MLRKILSAIAVLCALASPAFAAGTIPVALSQQFDANGHPLIGCNLYLYQVGTVATPQTAYQDTGLSQALPWPVTCDGNGRLPMFYLADGSVHPRLTDSAGVVQFDYPSMLVIGPSSGGGGGSTVDPTTIASTGDVKFRPTSEFLTGWVKINGQTIGSATSGASGRANNDTQNLFVYLWQNCTDAHCPVVGGRGSSGLADFNANKQITVPDWRARAPVGLDDMGNTPAGRLLSSNVTSGGGDGVTTPGAWGGEANHLLTVAESAQITLTTNITDSRTWSFGYQAVGVGASGGTSVMSDAANIQSKAVPVASGTITATTTSNAGGGAHNVMDPFVLGTWFMKL